MANLQLMQQQADAYNQQLGKYNAAAKQYSFDADVYNKQLKEYQGLVDAYNAKLDVYNRDIGNPYKAQVDAYNAAVSDYNARAANWNKNPISFTWYSGNVSKATPEYVYNKIVESANKGNHSQQYYDWINNNLNYLKSNYYPGTLNASQPAAPTPFTETRPGDFTAVKPEMTETMPKDPGFTGQQMKQLLGQKTAAQQERESAGGDVGLIQQALGRKKQPDSIIGGMLQNVRYST